MKASDLVCLIYRPFAKNYRQLPFFSYQELESWSTRKPYCDEIVRVITIKDSRPIGDHHIKTTDLVEHVILLRGL